ncbi:hypothetical protein SDC9_125884 [bioreactor metagenome]|uniref:Uncharacterized protein n=1 Tax=bioreactor metagenome TaxID=1076179 RepID=A0A645CPN3_9ZZZZ
MERVIAAALAPADPSPQDYSVATSAKQIIAESKNQEKQIKAEKDSNKTKQRNTVNDKSYNTDEISKREQKIYKGEAKLQLYSKNQENSDNPNRQQKGKITSMIL